jgi:CHAP domain-containing protein
MKERGQAATEAVLVAALLAMVGLLALAAVRAHPVRATTATARATAQAPVGITADGAPLDLPVAGDATGIVAVASRLLQLGIRETRTNAGPWIATFTDGNAEAWCADFVSYVLRLAGRPFSGGQSGGWRIAAAAGVRDWFAARGRYVPRVVAGPRPGDVVYFRHSHVGIVVAVRGPVLTTIEGNASDAVRERTYAEWRAIADIDGFGRP